MHIVVHTAEVQKACFVFLQLASGALEPDQTERVTKEILAAAACYVAEQWPASCFPEPGGNADHVTLCPTANIESVLPSAATIVVQGAAEQP